VRAALTGAAIKKIGRKEYRLIYFHIKGDVENEVLFRRTSENL
jgi:hypothetical protein